MVLAGSNSIDYEYGADGTKLRTVHKTGSTTLTTDYCGNAIYENGVLKMLLNEAGYVSFPDKKFHFYLKDHQGNTRVVADKDGNVEETNAYYPFGGNFTSIANIQPYKYNGKELDTKNGLNWYDYGARHYDAAIGRWHAIDPMSEKLYSLSQYKYCRNNPINRLDTDGKWDVKVHVHRNREVFGYGFLVVTDKSGNTIYNTTVRVEGSNSKENGYNKRNRSKTYADTPTGVYEIRGWSKRLFNLKKESYGPNDVLELDYKSGEAAGKRNGIHLHGGRQEGTGGKGKGATLKVAQGCLRIYDEDIKEMKIRTDLLEMNDSEESGNSFIVTDDLERIEDGPEPRPFDYARPKDEEENYFDNIFFRIFRVAEFIKM